MSEIADLRQIQRRVFQLTSFEDGLWDLLLGLMCHVSRDLSGHARTVGAGIESGAVSGRSGSAGWGAVARPARCECTEDRPIGSTPHA